MPRVNPDVLSWARQTAGLPLDDAARKIGFRDSRVRTAVDRLSALESGVEVPTRSVLVKMAKQYRRPLLAFYLAEPPGRGDRGEDFRTIPDALEPANDALVDALIRDVRARQQMVRSGLEDEEPEPLDFVGSLSERAGAQAVAAAMSERLRFSLQEFRRLRSPEEAFSYLRSLAESAGVFVLLIGNLGSHHTSLEPDVFRGFALADPIAPFVVINDQDAKAAWSFTLFHELAHLWIGRTGVSGGRLLNGLEQFCNDVASQLLLPNEELSEEGWRTVEDDLHSLVNAISTFARPRNLSYSLVAYRLFRAGVIDLEAWGRLSRHFRDLWRRQRASAREETRLNDASGPSYYVVKRHKVGNALLNFVRQRMDDGDLTPTKAGKILGVKPRSVDAMVRSSTALRVDR